MDQNLPKLPTEMIVHISKYLNVQDKLKLRLVNREFKTIFDYFIKLDQLTLIPDQTYFNYNWFYTNRLNNEIDLIELNDNNILNGLFKNKLFVNIKKLFFISYQVINLNETINQFKYLKELNMNCKLESDSILSLPKLKIFSFNQFVKDFKLELQTPSLSILRCEDLKYYQFNYPENMIYLEVQYIDNQIQVFKNLKYLILDRIGNIENLKSVFLTKFVNLKELHFNIQLIQKKDLNTFKNIDQIRFKIKLNNLKIFIFGIDYENLKQLEDNQMITNDLLELIFKNYSNTIDKLSFIDHMNFDKLFIFLNSNLSITLDNIIYKFRNIKHVTAINLNKNNIDCFFEFLSKLKNLYSLCLKLLIDNQIYYINQLPSSCKKIFELNLINLNIYESTNLDFLFKFKNLIYLSIGKLDDLDVLKNIPDYLEIDFEYIYNGKSLNIQYSNNSYTYKKNYFLY